jgi:hypothetical protein
MDEDDAALAELAFTATLIEWRGPAPFVFAPIPDEHVGEIAHAARSASYGWGVVPAEARIGRTRFTTSLFPRGGGYLLPVKVAVQRSEAIAPGSTVQVSLTIR